jgi:hypothetical protein
MYSVVCGLTHPRLCEDISHKNFEFFDISEDSIGTVVLINLMKDVLNPNKNKNIVQVFEDFFASRAIESGDENLHYQRILKFFTEYHRFYMGNKTTAIKFYLVKCSPGGNKVLDVIKSWKSYREKDEFKVKKKSKKNKHRVNI